MDIEQLKYVLSTEQKAILSEKGMTEYFHVNRPPDKELQKIIFDYSLILSCHEMGFTETYLIENQEGIFFASISAFYKFE